MKQHNFIQGSPEWHAHRATHFNASDAPAMLGCSPYMTRTQLLHKLHTGLTAEVDPATQRRFDDGHRYEALARPLAEKIIVDELAPVVGSLGELSASFDGLTLMADTAYEHKSLNDELRAVLALADARRALPKHYRVQMEQQLLVSGAERVLFMASKWDGETLIEELHCWYEPDPSLRAEVVSGWKQFAIDLAAYIPPAASTVEKIVAEPVESLPAPVVQVTGQLTLQDNFKVFEERLRHFLDHRLIREPKTDEDFVNLDAQIKAMKQAREALGAAEAQMLAQVQPVDQAKKTKDMLDKLLQTNLSMAERLLKDEKERRRGEIVAGGIAAMREHIAALHQRLGRPYMPHIPVDFAGVIKGKKSLASMEDAVASELARGKIEANRVADGIDMNLKFLREHGAQHAFLFNDGAAIVLKAHDDLQTLVRSRLAEHKADQEKKEAETRERIRAEEKAKAEKDAREKLAREQREAQEAEEALIASFQEGAKRIEHDSVPYIQKAIGTYESVAKDWENDPRPRVLAAFLAGRAYLKERLESAQARDPVEPRRQDDWAAKAPAPAPSAAPAVATQAPAANSPNVVALRPVAESTATIRLGQINERLAPLQITAAGLATLGFQPVGKEQSAVLYRESQFEAICEAIERHAGNVRERHVRQAA